MNCDNLSGLTENIKSLRMLRSVEAVMCRECDDEN